MILICLARAGRILCLAALWMTSCRPGAPADPQTSLFAEYLDTHFGRSIPAQPHHYLLVPASGCRGGMASALIEIDRERYPAEVTVLTTDPRMVHTYLRRQSWEVLPDATGDLDLLNLPVTNVSLIATRAGKITGVLSGRECADGPVHIIALLKHTDK